MFWDLEGVRTVGVAMRAALSIIRSYQGESTGSHPNSEVKHPWACSVLRWGTTWESQVTYVFVFAACGFDLCWSFGFESHSYFDCTFVYLRARLIPIVNIISVGLLYTKTAETMITRYDGVH